MTRNYEGTHRRAEFIVGHAANGDVCNERMREQALLHGVRPHLVSASHDEIVAATVHAQSKSVLRVGTRRFQNSEVAGGEP